MDLYQKGCFIMKQPFFIFTVSGHILLMLNTMTFYQLRIPLLMLLLISTTLLSCRKDHTCSCKIPGQNDIVATLKKMKKKEARNACDALERSYQSSGGTCELD